MPFVRPPPNVDPSEYTDEEKAIMKHNEWYNTKGNGYALEQSTQPQTLGYTLTDSPVGLLAWIYEKLVTWTDGYAWGDDEGTSRSLNLFFFSLTSCPSPDLDLDLLVFSLRADSYISDLL